MLPGSPSHLLGPPPAVSALRLGIQCLLCLEFDRTYKLKAAYCIDCQVEYDGAERDAKKHKWHDKFQTESKNPTTLRR